MTIGTIHTVICDECDKWAEPGFSPAETRRIIKEAGWHYIKCGDHYIDLCPKCWENRKKANE